MATVTIIEVRQVEYDPKTYIPITPVPAAGMVLKASREKKCPNGPTQAYGQSDWPWCTSSCVAYGPRHTADETWQDLVRWPASDPDGFVAELRKKLRRGDNHRVDISLSDQAGTFGSWRWIAMGEDIADTDAWCDHVRDLLDAGLRLRLYGDDHPKCRTS